MIGFLPEIYPDELVYSWIARYYSRTGYAAYIDAIADFYEKRTIRPDVEFINRLNKEAKEIITDIEPIEKLVMNHTMFPYYARFLKAERRKSAFASMIQQEGDAHNLLAIPVNREEGIRYVRYCPVCVAEDKELYGETYIHRSHQMMGVGICCRHSCMLKDSIIPIAGKASPRLYVLDSEITNMEVEQARNGLELRLAEYVTDVFQADMDVGNTVEVGKFLHSKLEAPYISARGEQRNLSLFYQDFVGYYRDILQQGCMEMWQIQKIFNGYRWNTFEVCQIAMFLGIPVDELVHMVLPEKNQEQMFDEKVRELHKQGLSYPEIAKRLGASVNIVKPIGEKRYGNQGKPRQHSGKGGIKGYDWTWIDKDTLPEVKSAVEKIYTGSGNRPRKVSAYAVAKEIGISDRRLKMLPECMALIKSYQESQEQYWAREVVWAVHQVQKDGNILVWRRIRDLTNLRRKDFEACLLYIDTLVDAEFAERIRGLL